MAAIAGLLFGAAAFAPLSPAQGNNQTPLQLTPLIGYGVPGSPSEWLYQAGIAVGADGTLYVVDSYYGAIYKIAPGGAHTTLAAFSIAPNGDHISARFKGAAGLGLDAAQNLYVAAAKSVYKIARDGTTTTVMQDLGPLDGIAVAPNGNIYVASGSNHVIHRVTPAGVITTFAGKPGEPGSADGTGSARFNHPVGVAVDSSGTVYVADYGNNAIRKITPNGVVSTLAGLPLPIAVAVDDHGIVFATEGGGFSSYDPYRLDQITPDGLVTRIRTSGGYDNLVEDGFLTAIAIDHRGTFYVLDGWYSTVLKSASPPNFTRPVASQSVAPGGTTTFSIGVDGTGPTSYQWLKNGVQLPGATSNTLVVTNAQPASAGLYSVSATNAAGTSLSEPAALGLSGWGKVFGAGTEVGADIAHPNGNVYDQVLLQGEAATITADAGQITRLSYVDLNDDIVQVEFGGAGALTLVLQSPTGPAAPVNYVQPGVSYMKGHATIVVAGATATTHVSVFSVGRITASDQALFKAASVYDGVADLARLAILSADGKCGSVRTANANYFASAGLTGLYAPGVQFAGPVYIGDISAFDAATPALVTGSVSDARIAGGDLFQNNGQPVKTSGLTQLTFVAGSTSHGGALPAQKNRAVLQQDYADVTAQIAVNP